MIRSSALATCLLLGALGCSGSDDTDKTTDGSTTETGDSGGTTTDGAVWSEAFVYEGPGALSGVWGSGPDDVWMVGGTTETGEIYHFDGSDWSEVTPPAGTPLLVWVYGFGPDDVWSVGLDGVVVHYDGSDWTTLDSGTTEDLWGVFGFSSDDLWIVGGFADTTPDPVILHFDGTTFEPYVLTAEENERGATTMFKIWGYDASSLFMVGQRGQINQWDGTNWAYSGAGPNADQDFVSLWGTSADNIVAVGGRGNGRIATWDGSAWDTLQPSGIGGLNGVTMIDPNTAVVGGINGYVGVFDVETATLTAELAPTTIDVHALWYDGAGTTYGVSGRFLPPYGGNALMRTED